MAAKTRAKKVVEQARKRPGSTPTVPQKLRRSTAAAFRRENVPTEASQVRPGDGKALGKSPTTPIAVGYAALLNDLKQRIRRAQIRAAAANEALIRLYWDIGREIVQRQKRERWGAKVIGRLAADLQKAFPGQAGFSRTNIHRARTFYLAYTAGLTIAPQVVGQLPDDSALAVPAPDGVNLPQPVSEIPWGHNLVLLEKLKDPAQRLWYAQKTLQHGWSRAVLVHQIEVDLYGRESRAVCNFSQTLPAPQSDLAQQTLKDPYVFDFLTLADEARQRELERRTFVVIDLKVEEFKPEFAGKMSFYLSAVDDRLRHSDDQLSIGIVLCRARDRVTVEYARRDNRKPSGVSEYRLTKSLPRELKSSLPTISRLEEKLKKRKPPALNS